MDILGDMEDFRNERSEMLDKRLQIFKKAMNEKYGTYDNIKSDEILPLQSKDDVNIINRLIDTKDFVIIPIYNNGNIYKAYTVGMWYYWGLPELVCNFTTPIIQKQEFLHVFINILKLKLYKILCANIIVDKKIDRNIFNYDNMPPELKLKIDVCDECYTVNKLDDGEYLDKTISHMLWFHMYYIDHKCDENNDPLLYPVYKLDITETEYLQLENKLTILMNENSPDKNESDISSIESDNDN